MSYVIDWSSRTHWRVLPMPVPPEAADWPGVPIADMTDGQLWEVINWCVAEMIALYIDAGSPAVHSTRGEAGAGLSAKFWLRDQPTFVALVLVSVERELAFHPDTAAYLQRFALRPNRQPNINVPGIPPWKNPGLLRDQSLFRRAVNKDLDDAEKQDDNASARRWLDIRPEEGK